MKAAIAISIALVLTASAISATIYVLFTTRHNCTDSSAKEDLFPNMRIDDSNRRELSTSMQSELEVMLNKYNKPYSDELKQLLDSFKTTPDRSVTSDIVKGVVNFSLDVGRQVSSLAWSGVTLAYDKWWNSKKSDTSSTASVLPPRLQTEIPPQQKKPKDRLPPVLEGDEHNQRNVTRPVIVQQLTPTDSVKRKVSIDQEDKGDSTGTLQPVVVQNTDTSSLVDLDDKPTVSPQVSATSKEQALIRIRGMMETNAPRKAQKIYAKDEEFIDKFFKSEISDAFVHLVQSLNVSKNGYEETFNQIRNSAIQSRQEKLAAFMTIDLQKYISDLDGRQKRSMQSSASITRAENLLDISKAGGRKK